MERINIFFLHGFLGRPNDWDPVISFLPKNFLGNAKSVRYFPVDYLNHKDLNSENNFQDWAAHFNQWVSSISEKTDVNLLVGYSLGGRLGLHALNHCPELWHKSVFISVNPGFADDLKIGSDSLNISISKERHSRRQNDNEWAENFLNMPWSDLLSVWNAQVVFHGSKAEPIRCEKDYSRNLLALALRQWSLSRQNNFRKFMNKYSSKILWLVGDRDKKFLDLAMILQKEVEALEVGIIPESSHRVLFDQPCALAEKIQAIIEVI